MKGILQNLNYAAPYPGNLMRSIFSLEKACEGKYKIVYLFPSQAIALSWVQEMKARGCEVYFKSNKDKDLIKLLCDIITKHNVRIIHTHFYSLKEYKCIKKLPYKDVKTVLHHHNHFMASYSHYGENVVLGKLKKIYRAYQRKKCKRVISSDVNIACGDSVAFDLKEKKFNNVVCIENAIDFSRLVDCTLHKKEDFGLNEHDKTALIFGFAFERKGVDIALKAIETIADEYEIKLCIVFAANEEEGKNKIINMYGCIPEWVEILTPNDNIAEYYNITDIFLSPSREEGFCYSMVEAAFCGCNLIISDIPGQEHARNFCYKHMIKKDSVDELRTSIIEIIKCPMSDAQKHLNRDYVERRYSLDKWCEKVINVYDGIV